VFGLICKGDFNYNLQVQIDIFSSPEKQIINIVEGDEERSSYLRKNANRNLSFMKRHDSSMFSF